MVKFRDIPQEAILEAIDQADQEMYDNGIVAVGDISNLSPGDTLVATSSFLSEDLNEDGLYELMVETDYQVLLENDGLNYLTALNIYERENRSWTIKLMHIIFADIVQERNMFTGEKIIIIITSTSTCLN